MCSVCLLIKTKLSWLYTQLENCEWLHSAFVYDYQSADILTATKLMFKLGMLHRSVALMFILNDYNDYKSICAYNYLKHFWAPCSVVLVPLLFQGMPRGVIYTNIKYELIKFNEILMHDRINGMILKRGS